MAKKKERIVCSECHQTFHGTSECKPAPDGKGNKDQQWIGNELRKSYVSLRKLNPVEGAQDYTIVDAICALMHHARKRGLDAEELAWMAVDHFQTEVTICLACGMAEAPEAHDCKYAAEPK